MKKLIALAFVAALSVACSKKKAEPTTPTNTTPTTEEKAADPCAGQADPCAGTAPADPCAGGAADPCAGQ